MLNRIPLLAVLVAGLALGGQAQARGSDRDAAIAGAVLGAVVGGVIVANSRYAPAPAYVEAYPPPAVVYYPAQPAYYPPPQPVYYPPQPTYYQPYPVVVAPRHSFRRHHHKHHGRSRGYYARPRW